MNICDCRGKQRCRAQAILRTNVEGAQENQREEERRKERDNVDEDGEPAPAPEQVTRMQVTDR